MRVTWARPVAIAGGLLLLAACGGRSQPEGPPQFAELMPAPMMQAAAPPPAPVATEPAQPMAAPPPASSGPVFGGHLASYTKEADAVRGWNVIVRQQSSIGSLKRHIVPAETPKGHMLRLIAGDFTTADEATRFCTWAKQQGLYCQVMQLPADGSSATPTATGRPAARRPGQRSSAAPAAAPAMSAAAAPLSRTPVAAAAPPATPVADLAIPASGSPIPLRAGARP
jgi:hypothetical protein